MGKEVFFVTKFNEEVSEKSEWISITPTETALNMPFYMTEIGCFYANINYSVKRDYHDSFLLLYTVSGEGIVREDETEITLPEGNMVVIDCHKAHEYKSVCDVWNFMWMHFSGVNTEKLLKLIYHENIFPVSMANTLETEKTIRDIMTLACDASVKNSSDISMNIHKLYTMLLNDSIEMGKTNQRIKSDIYVEQVIDYVKENYQKPIGIDDMLSKVPVSKYHFIRIFKRIMGVTPYNYLLLYRINRAKELLRNSNKSISQISEMCGYLDVSNFIEQFKKHTNQKPLKYRQTFSVGFNQK